MRTIEEAREQMRINHDVYGEQRAQFIYEKDGIYQVANSDECAYAEKRGWTFVE